MHPDLLPHVTPIVLTALTSPEIALYATMALKDMSRDCAEGMKPYSEVKRDKGYFFLIKMFLCKSKLRMLVSFRHLGNYQCL